MALYKLTDCRESGPSACYSSIFYWPEVITDRPPGLILTDLHSTFPRHHTTNKSNAATVTTCNNTAGGEVHAAYLVNAINLRIWHVTPASSACPLQKSIMPMPPVETGQSISRCSLPRQSKSSSQMGPVPWPKKAFECAVAPVETMMIQVRTQQFLLCYN